MEKKAVVVTGACGGIGHAIVQKCLRNGFFVFGLDVRDNGFSHPDYFFIPVDITSRSDVRAAYGQIADKTDSLWGLVNAAGIVFMGSVVEEDSERMQKILDVNVSGPARVVRVFFPLLERGKGRIVNLSSEYGTFCSLPFHGLYTASKHAMEAYSDSLRRELGFLGMKVTVIRPGAVDTPMTHGTLPAFDRLLETTTHFGRSYRKLYPLMAGATKHPTDPDEIAKAVVKALTARRPKRYVPVSRDGRVWLLSRLPAAWTDAIFRLFFR